MSRPIVNHDLRVVDGVTLFLPPNRLGEQISLKEPDVYAESETALYPIGTLAWYAGMGKKFRYCKAGDDLTGLTNLVVNGNRPPTSSSYADRDGFYGNVATKHDEGVTEITFTDTIDRVKDYYEGAELIIFDADRGICFENSHIISGPPTAIVFGTTDVVVTLHKAKKYAIVANDGIQIWLSPYSNIVNHDYVAGIEGAPAGQYQTCMGVPLIPIKDDYYFWLQTSGPTFITPNGWSTLCPGFAANSRTVWVHQDGGIITATDATGQGDQRIGVLLSLTESGSADAWVDMDLDLGH